MDEPLEEPEEPLLDEPEEPLLDEPLSDELLLDELDDVDPLSDEAPLELLSEPATFFFLPDLKSVSYQPPPFSRKPAADTFLRNAGLAHCGHSLRTSSLSV